MSAGRTLATTGRVLAQIRHDPRTIALIVVVPCVLLGLVAWAFDGTPVFDRVGGPVLGIFPFTVMFIVTSVVTLRERRSGTLDRLMTTPLGRAEFLGGYTVAFGLLGVLQAVVATAWAVWVCGLDIAGEAWLLVLVALLVAVLGVALGLMGSAFASTELQAVQLMPAFVLPQLFLCGLFIPREQLPTGLSEASDVLPLSYAVDAMIRVAQEPGAGPEIGADVAVLAGFLVGAVLLAALTLRRRTP